MEESYRIGKYNIPSPIVKIYIQQEKNSFYCNTYNILHITDKVEENKLIIVNKNKIIDIVSTENSNWYFVLEKQEKIKKGQKFTLYFYDTPEVKNSNIVKKYIKQGFNVHFRPWIPNEDITKVVE